jgi:hypothetical protein
MTFIKEHVADLGYLAQKSADGRLRTSSQISQGDYKQINDLAGGSWNTELIGGGTATYEGDAVGGTELAVTAVSGDAVIRQTYQWHNYFAGKPLKVELTASAFQPQSTVTKRMGYFSSSTASPFSASLDGFFFESDGTTLRCKIYRNGTEIFNLPQASWLNQDKLGSFDSSAFNFYVIDFLYLGGAVANFWILTEFGLTKVATYQHINVDQNTFIKSPNQPLRYEISTTGSAGNFNHICCDVAVEGLLSRVGAERTYNTGFTETATLTADNRYAILGIRQAFRNQIIDIRRLSVLSGTADDLLVELYYGGVTVGSPTWGAIPFTYMEGFLGTSLGAVANAVHSGGVRIFGQYVRGAESLATVVDNARRLGSYIDGNLEEAYLCVTPLTANATVVGGIEWVEF